MTWVTRARPKSVPTSLGTVAIDHPEELDVNGSLHKMSTRSTTQIPDHPSTPAPATRNAARQIQIVIGLLWLLDGALQLQPFMFGRGFASKVISPAGDGQPHFVSSGVNWSAAIILTHPAVFDALFAIIQLGLGIGLLYRPTVRLALAGSIGWALCVWYFGEGLGGLASGHAWMLTGAPGAAFLYAVVAAALWPRVTGAEPGTDERPMIIARWFPYAWATIWIGAAVLNLLPGQNSARAMADVIAGNADSAPHWLANIDRHLGDAIRHGGPGLIAGVVALQILIGVGGLASGGGRRLATSFGAALAITYWLVGQSLGEVYSGQATDPNSGPLILLFAAVLFARGRPPSVSTASAAIQTSGLAAP